MNVAPIFFWSIYAVSMVGILAIGILVFFMWNLVFFVLFNYYGFSVVIFKYEDYYISYMFKNYY